MRWDDNKGYGFIAPAHGSDQIFVHIKAFPAGSPRPRIGDTLRFVKETTHEGKVRARTAVLDWDGTGTQPAAIKLIGAASMVTVATFLAAYLVVNFYWPLPLWVSILYAGASIVAFVGYAIDKRAAGTGGWRVPETSLLLMGLIGGWPGAILAQQFLRHKTKKALFRSVFWLTVLANVVAFFALATPVVPVLTDAIIQLLN